ncbi:MAG: hypothetical protein Q7J34_02195 [Bacteroidales bacterium]|nr:hypothetical protein [Bacteroidales bacterium]
MKNIKLGVILFFILFVLPFGCSDSEDSPIPTVYVNFTINPASIQYNNLNIPGNYATLNGGYRGIIVFHFIQDQYIAYERTCTFDSEKACSKLIVDNSGLIAEDTCCGSKFLLTDGSPLEGSPATRALKRYNTSYDAYHSLLHIYN